MDTTKIKLTNVKIIFANFKDEGFGTNITIDATNPEVQEAIKKWVKDNNIGKGDKAGVANFKEYKSEDADTIIQYTFKHNKYTKFIATNAEFNEDMLGYGAEISLIANSFPVDNKFMKGNSSALLAVKVIKPKTSGADDAVKELEGDLDF
jgi:hypothetical protein